MTTALHDASFETILFHSIEYVGVLTFAMSGAYAAMEKKLDIFGVLLLAYIAACGGGIMRDTLIGAIPSANITNIYYLITSMAAGLLTATFGSKYSRFIDPVLLFDALGLALFCVIGAQKAYLYTNSIEASILAGVVSSIGGGLLRDTLLNRISLILQKDIYATAALIGSSITIVFQYMDWGSWGILLGMLTCFSLRILSLHYKWTMIIPSLKK